MPPRTIALPTLKETALYAIDRRELSMRQDNQQRMAMLRRKESLHDKEQTAKKTEQKWKQGRY